MPTVINNENYNGLGSLYANAGDWIDAICYFSVRFSVGSGTQNKFIYNSFAGNYTLSIQQGDIGADHGFVAGDTITCTYTMYVLPGPFQAQTFTTTILYISGNTMFIADPFTLAPPFNAYEHINGRQFPTDSYVNGLLVVADKQPSSIEFEFNLVKNGGNSLSSVIDGEVNRWEKEVVTGMPTGVPQPMEQFVNKSGGLMKDVELTLVSTPGAGWRNYRITYKAWQWGVIKDGIEPPNYYDAADHLAPIAQIKCFSQYGNPNGIQSAKTENTEANTGFFDENLNGGVNPYTFQSIEWFDSLGNPIDKLDNSGLSSFVAVINAPNQVNPTSTYRLGLVWRPENDGYYSNLPTNIGENLLLLAPENDFVADGVVDPTVYQGYENPNGARWDFLNIKYELTGVNELTITGQVDPNGAAQALFAGIADGGRKSTLWTSIGDVAFDGGVYSKRVSLRIFDEDNYDAPTIGVQIPNVVDENLIDHGGININAPIPQTTTEDDVLYRSHFRLIDGVQYDGVRARFWAYNSNTEEEFTLEDIFFSFDNVPFVANQFQPNINVPRGFNLPPSSDRNAISLVREPSLDIAGLYALKLDYGYLSRWEYWLEQSNVDNAFFDALLQWNGKNKNWQRFFLPPDWTLRVSYYLRLNGVDDFNNFDIGIRPYEDDVNLSTTWDFEVISSGATPSNLVANELHNIKSTLVWAIGAYTNPWAEITIEDFEAGNRWVISSVLAQGGISSNPLKPQPGFPGLEINLTAANIAELKCQLDTSLIDADKVCLSARIYSEDKPIPPEWEWLIVTEKDAERAYSDARRLNLIYTGPLIRVRRGGDNLEADIPYIQIGAEWVLDEAFLLKFASGADVPQAWIVTRYDQSWQNQHAVQLAMNSQPPIVIDGVVVKDPDTNRPAHLSNGLSHWHPMPAVANYNRFTAICVHGIEPTALNPQSRVGFGVQAGNYPATYWWYRFGVNGGILYDFMGATSGINNIHFAGQLQTGAQLNMVWRVASNDIEMRLNGINGTVINEASSPNQLNTLDRYGVRYHRGYKSEDVYWGQDQDQTAAWIENNVNNFYNIF